MTILDSGLLFWGTLQCFEFVHGTRSCTFGIPAKVDEERQGKRTYRNKGEQRLLAQAIELG